MLDIRDFLKINHISLSRFINYCLYKKDQGFYQKNSIGTHFITSPEVSQLFGECIAIFFLLILKKYKISSFCELGPGNGTLMKDLITILKKFIDDSMSFYLYEKSIFLKNLQMNNLSNLNTTSCKINFLSRPKFKKEPIFFFCNEFFDALPINQFEKVNNSWFEKRVTYSKSYEIINVKTFEKFNKNYKNGDIIEVSPLSQLYLIKILKHIKQYGGGFLIFDYGPFSKSNINTLQALHNSKKCDILDYPFQSDITYHVNFKDFTSIADKLGLISYGPITQKDFLFFHGINERVLNIISQTSSTEKVESLNKQFERLTSPSGMGGLIKCIYISREKIDSKVFKL